MFTKDFYPTPEKLIKKMLKPYEISQERKDKLENSRFNSYYNYKYEGLRKLNILEPSAGKGNIANFLTKNCSVEEKNISVIENNPDLQAILRDKNYPLIASDFLTYKDDQYFDLIIMNPPFKNGDEHLLHAIEIAKNTDIICILNAETLKNPYTKTRKLLLSKIEKFGSFEYLKDEFTQSERKTKVEIALIRLKLKDESKRFEFDFKDFETDKIDFNFDVVNNDVARKDLIGNLNIRYTEVRKVYTEYLEAEAKYRHFLGLFLEGERFDFELKDGTPQERYNHLSNQMKAHMWRKVIDELDVEKYMSAKVKSNFNAFIKQQSKMAFTKDNVASFFQMIMNNRVNIWDQAVLDVFDMLTSYYKDNRNYIEGWRTNDKFMVNRKLILPNWCAWDTSYMDRDYLKRYGVKFEIDYRDTEKYNDIDKVMAYLMGHTLQEYNKVSYVLKSHFEKLGNIYPGEKFKNTCESAYFKIKFFKKGTVHLEFKDEKLWSLFNKTACAGKNWLPDNERTAWEEEKRKRRQERYKREHPKEEENDVLMIEAGEDKIKEQEEKKEILVAESGQVQLF